MVKGRDRHIFWKFSQTEKQSQSFFVIVNHLSLALFCFPLVLWNCACLWWLMLFTHDMKPTVSESKKQVSFVRWRSYGTLSVHYSTDLTFPKLRFELHQTNEITDICIATGTTLVMRITKPYILRIFSPIFNIFFSEINSTKEQRDFSLPKKVRLDFISITVECCIRMSFGWEERRQKRERLSVAWVPESEEVVNAAGFRRFLI